MQELVLKNLDAVFYADLSALAQQQGQDLESYIVSLLQEALTKQQQRLPQPPFCIPTPSGFAMT